MTETPISHAFVLPDRDFHTWRQALLPYLEKFKRVVLVRDPAGNDLNPYRNVSAVTSPNTWLRDDPLFHIRRIYPSVVRVDVVQATTPQQLQAALQERIARNDRFGETLNNGAHLSDRFVLAWPTRYRPIRIVSFFNARASGNENSVAGIDIASSNNVKVIAAVAGKVTRQWAAERPDERKLGKYVQVTTQHAGQTYMVTYANLGSVDVPLHSEVQVGDVIGKAGGEHFTLILQSSDMLDPTEYLYVDALRVRPTVQGLRVRTIPGLDGQIMGQIDPWDLIISKEMHGRTIRKAGIEGEWLRIRLPDGRNGYSAAWFLEATTNERLFLGVNPVGVNLDQLHPLGAPDASRLGDIGWVRFGYNVSNNRGSEDIAHTFERYAPLAERYVNAGYKVLFTTSHQTYGEGKAEFWPWPQMSDDKWRRLTERFADMMGRISQQWAGRGLVHCWQVWNEQDAPIGAVASVPMSAENYGRMLAQVVPAIRSADHDVFVISGGHTAGPTLGSVYAKSAIRSLTAAALPDGVAFHPYGRGTNTDSIYARFGHIDESVQAFSEVLPGKAVWITEWGILDRPDDSPGDIANYATNFISYLKARYPAQIATMIWFAWAQGMHNGYGIVDTANNPRPPLTERFLQA